MPPPELPAYAPVSDVLVPRLEGAGVTLGEEAELGAFKVKINGFLINGDKMNCNVNDNLFTDLTSLVKTTTKQPLLTTSDGIQYCNKSDTLFFVNSLWWWQESTLGNYIDMVLGGDLGRQNKYPCFSEKENARNYTDENKPQFSKKDMIDFTAELKENLKSIYSDLNSGEIPHVRRYGELIVG